MDIPNIEELVGLFEAEASNYSKSTPPEFQELKFITMRGTDKLEVEIYAPTGSLKLRWHQGNVLRNSVCLLGLNKLEVHLLKDDEFLSATRTAHDSQLMTKLRLKPNIGVEINEIGVT